MEPVLTKTLYVQFRGVGAWWAGWARAHPLFYLIFSEKECLLTHFLLPLEWFLVLPTHFEEASDAPDKEVNLIVLWLILDSKDDFISIDLHFFLRLYVLFSVPLLPLKKAR